MPLSTPLNGGMLMVSKRVVGIAGPDRKALGDPYFIIKDPKKDAYFVAVAVLGFDPKAPHITPEQAEGVKKVKKMYDDGAKAAVVTTAVQVDGEWNWVAQNTEPDEV